LTRLLIVEDDATLARSLARAVARACPAYVVLTAFSGAEAVRVLEGQPIDLVLTDLQMEGMDGFELLAWLINERPSVLLFAMTGYSTSEAQARLRALGGIECFDKPIDVRALIARLSESLAQSVHGHVRNIALASLLQIVEIERKTCTLEVRSEDGVGRLYVRAGELVDARTSDESGEAAALRILAFEDASIGIENRCLAVERTITLSMGQLVMEAMRLCDERRRTPSATPATSDEADPPRLDARAAPRPVPRRLSSLPPFADLLSIVDVTTGHLLAYDARDATGVQELAAGAAMILRQEQVTLDGLAPGEQVEEIVLSSGSRCEILRPLPGSSMHAVLLVFDTSETNLVIARLELTRFLTDHAAALASLTAMAEPPAASFTRGAAE